MRVRDQARCRRTRQAGGDPDPGPAGGPTPSRDQWQSGPRLAAEAEEGPPLPALPRASRRSGPYLSPGADCGCGAAREGPDRGLPAGSPPERRARGAEGSLVPKDPTRRARLDAAAPGASGRSVTHAGVPSAPQLRQREPAPGRSRSPSGGRRRRRRGGAKGSSTRSPGSSCGRGGARCEIGLIPRGQLRATQGKSPLPLRVSGIALG